MKTNHVKTKLKQGEVSLGAWLNFPSLDTARLMGWQGFDWLTIDMEHGAFNSTNMSHIVAAVMETGTTAPIVRVPDKSPEWFKWALDAGAWGIIVPQVNNRQEAENIVNWSKYAPQGNRSLGGIFASYTFGTTDKTEYFTEANNEIMLIVQIETADGLANVEDILSVPGLDVAFVGPNDLHCALGLPPSSEGAEPEFEAALAKIKAAAKRNNLAVGMFSSNGEAAARRAQEGFQMISITTDVWCLASGATQNLKAARG